MLSKMYEKVSRRFAKDRRGVAAIEAAIIFPVMVTVFTGLVDLSSANRLSRDLDRAAASVASIVVSEARFTRDQKSIVLNGLANTISGSAGEAPPPTPTNSHNPNTLQNPNGIDFGFSSLSIEPEISRGRGDPKMKVMVLGVTNDGGTYRTEWSWAPYGNVDAEAPTALFNNALPEGAFGVVVYVQKTHNSFFGSGALGNYTLSAAYAARPTKTTRILN